MGKLNTLLYSVLMVMFMSISANANYQMFSDNENTYIYNDKDGSVYLFQAAFKTGDDLNKETFIQIGYHFKYPTPEKHKDSIKAK